MKKMTLTAGLLVALSVTSATAEGYTVQDLGTSTSREACMSAGESAMRRYVDVNGGGNVDPTTWVVYGWDLQPGDQDVTIMCPVVSGGIINGFMVVHGESTDDERIYTADTLARLFDNPK